MQLQRTRKWKWQYMALAFALPCLGMLCVMALSGYAPFGNSSMLYSDMYHQYYPFFVAFRRALRSGDSLLYSWNVGMGMDYLGLISYYLASPLNLLSVFVPESQLLNFFSLLMPLKLGFAGLFFALFLKKTFSANDISIAIFGAFYALCAWALGYQWNIMWLDTFALLPLVALGTVSLLRDKRFVLYTLTLFLSVFANYYIGFFTCIFVALTFFCYEICRGSGIKRFFADLGRIALFSLLAIGMTAILEVPALAALQTTQSSVNNFPTGFRLNIATEQTWRGLLTAMARVAGNTAGGLEPTFKEGLPNLYCGIGSLILAFLFLTSKRVKLRDKLCSVFLLVFFMVSFIIRQLDYIWHGFHFTNMIPYRFSFLFSFVLLYMAYRAYLIRRFFRPWQVICAAILAFGCVLCAQKWDDPIFLCYNGILIVLYLLVFLLAQFRKSPPEDADEQERKAYLRVCIQQSRISSLLLCAVLGLELVLNLVNFGVSFPGTIVTNYPRGTTYAASMIRYMNERETGKPFFRAEVTHTQTLNDGALNGYNGISTFTSSANVRVTEFMRRLGYGAKNTYNRYCFEESSPVANLFLNLKYMIERDGNVKDNPYFDEVHHYGNVYLLENNAYLPLGFLCDSALAQVDFDSYTDNFTFQNYLLKAAAGTSINVWHFLSESSRTVTASEGVQLTHNPKVATSSYQCTQQSGEVVYSYSITREGLLCIDLNLTARNNFRITKNGTEVVSDSYSLPQTASVCRVSPGDTVQVHLTCSENTSGNITVLAATLDETAFRRAYDRLSDSTLSLTRFSNTHIEGTINANRSGLLYTSIPQNGDSWRVTVDGVAVTPTLVGGAMIAVPLTEGTHIISLHYHNAAFSLGWKISLACALIFLALVLLEYLPKRQRGKFQK